GFAANRVELHGIRKRTLESLDGRLCVIDVRFPFRRPRDKRLPQEKSLLRQNELFPRQKSWCHRANSLQHPFKYPRHLNEPRCKGTAACAGAPCSISLAEASSCEAELILVNGHKERAFKAKSYSSPGLQLRDDMGH